MTKNKLSLVVLSFILFPFAALTQNINIPDSLFLDALISEGVDLNDDGQIQLVEASIVRELVFSQVDFNSIEGLESFGNLEKLEISYNDSLEHIDLTELSKLTDFTLFAGQRIISIVCHNLDSIESINLYENPVLIIIDLKNLNPNCDLNVTKNESLENIDFSNLETLRFLRLIENQSISNYNLSGLSSLLSLQVREHENLENINLGTIKKLRFLDFYLNPSLDELDFNSIDSVEQITVEQCHSLTELIIQNKADLETLFCFENQNLKELRLNNLDLLRRVTVRNNSVLSELELVSSMGNLEELTLWGNAFENIDYLKIPNLESLNFWSNGFIGKFEIANLPNLKILNLSGNNFNQLDLFNLPLLEYFSMNNCDSITQIGLQELPLLKSIGMNLNDNLESIDLSYLQSVEGISFWRNKSSFLNLSGITNSPSLSFSSDEVNRICASQSQFSWIQDEVDTQNITLDHSCGVPGWIGIKDVNIKLNYSDLNDCDENSTSINPGRFEIISNNHQALISPPIDDNQYYRLNLPEGNFEVSPLIANSQFFSINPSSISISIDSLTTQTTTEEICVTKLNDPLTDLSIHVVPLSAAQAGFNVQHRIVIENNGNTPSSGQFNYEFQEEKVEFLNSDYDLTSENGILIGNFEDLRPFEKIVVNVEFKLNSPMDSPPLNDGDQLYFVAGIYTQSQDANGTDNRFILVDEVINSFDPNDKNCNNGDYILLEHVGEKLSYKIRFENTGSTSAKNIRISDLIDSTKFDIESLTTLESSHPVTTQIINNEASFIFNDILLSHEENNNKGFLIFQIRTKNTLQLNDILKNTAEIYFDYNYPIITDTSYVIVAEDLDLDGFIHSIDCDDSNPNVNPDSVEIIYNGLDDDCNINTLDDDLDQDGYPLLNDCDDSNPSINPDSTEIIDNEYDEDCDGVVQTSRTFMVSPNPFRDKILINVNGDQQTYTARLYDIYGQLIIEKDNATEMHLHENPSGTYILEIAVTNTSEKFINLLVKTNN